MHKAVAMLQFKLEGAVIREHPEFHMEDRLLLNRIDFKENTIHLDGKAYPLKDNYFPTVNIDNPYELTPEELDVIEKLKYSFRKSEKLQKHAGFLIAKGGMYLSFNSNLLYHGCVPLKEDGRFAKVLFGDSKREYCGKALLDRYDTLIREGYMSPADTKEKAFSLDIMWYLWAGPLSPLFGKKKMATFERYFIEDEETHREFSNAYYDLITRETTCQMIFEEFGLDIKSSHIINGHVPVITKKGESPIKANGRLLVIDGGFSRAYQNKTGIAGYTLINNSYGLSLVSHSPFESAEKAVREEKDIISTTMVLESEAHRKLVGDTDIGAGIKSSIEDLEELIEAYRKGKIKEKLQ